MARVVVIGGGLGGAASAARLAKLGHAVTLLEATDRIGGVLDVVEQDGFAWETGPAATAMPAVLRDLFRKSGRALEREVDLVAVTPLREHRFPDRTVLALPPGSRAAQLTAVEDALGSGLGRQWVDYVHSFADIWDVLRRGYLERSWTPELSSPEVRSVLRGRETLQRRVVDAFTDDRLRALALTHTRAAGQDPRRVPAWHGLLDYVEQCFGTWSLPGGTGRLGDLLGRRLTERRVEVHLGTPARDLVLRGGRVVAVRTATGDVDADVVVCAVDPRTIPALAPMVRRTRPVLPPAVCDLGLDDGAPDLPDEVVLHGDPTRLVRRGSRAPDGGQAWRVLTPSGGGPDVLETLSAHGLDVAAHVVLRVDRSPQSQLGVGGGSPYGVQWRGRRTVTDRLTTRTPLPGVYCAGAHVAGLAELPFVGLTAAVVAEQVGAAPRTDRS